MTSVRVVEPNKLLSVQDAGRKGAMRYGVSQSGPMDFVRFRHALSLAGGETAAFEIGIAGASFEADGTVTVALTGPGFSARVGAETVSAPARLSLPAGGRFDVVPGRTGMWAYLAVAGIDFGEPVLGSFATNVRTGLGARDFSEPFKVSAKAKRLDPLAAQDISFPTGPIGLLPGPQAHLFAQDVRDLFAAAPYTLSAALDRMGYKLEGEPLRANTHDIISDGIVEGSIQVPGNGQPIILCADRAPTGGYPKIAVVASADMPRLTQSRPGDGVRFAWLDERRAAERRRALIAALAEPERPRVRTDFDAEYLASRNLIGGVITARDPD